MEQLVKRLAKMTAGYGMVQWAGPFLSLAFTPIITRILNPDDYGTADYIMTIGSAAANLALLALSQALGAHFNDQPDPAWQRRVTGSALVLAAVNGLIVGGLIVLLAPQLAGSAPVSQGYTGLFRLVGTLLVFGLCSSVLTAAAQLALRVRWGMWLSLTQILATVAGNVLFIIILRWGVTGMVLVPGLMSGALCLVGLALVRPLIGRPSWATSRLLLHAGLWLLPATLAGWALQVADRLILAQYVSAEELGHYAIANKIASLLFVAIGPLFTAYTPLALAIQHQPDARQRYATLARYLMAAVLFAGLGLGLFAMELLIVLTRTAYLPAAVYVGFLAYMHIFGALYQILYTGGLAGKQFSSITWAVVAGTLVNLGLNVLLIPPYRLWGATAATFISYAVSPALLYMWLRRRYPVPYPAGRIGAALAVQLALLAAGLFIPPMTFPLRVGLKLIVWLLLPVAYVMIGMLTASELQQARGLLRQRLTTRRPVTGG